MSIWSSVGETVKALDGHEDSANYDAAGEAALDVDIAITSLHDHIRLGVWGNGLHVCALLSPAAAKGLRDRLSQVLGPDRWGASGVLVTDAADSDEGRSAT